MRFAFAAEARRHDPDRALDEGIVQALWLTYDEILARRGEHSQSAGAALHRRLSASGKRLPLDVVTEASSL